MKAPTHNHGAGSRASEGAAARRSSSPTSPHWTEAYLGMPYEEGGGCWIFFRHVELQHFGVRVPIVTHPGSLPKLLRKVPAAARELGWQQVTEPRSGDAVLMAHWKHPSHVGIYVDDIKGGGVLHCVDGAGSVLHTRAHLKIAHWRIVAFYRPLDTAALELAVPGHG